ncbi:unnamed protein product, partial [Heterosigma akashiwo]
RAVPLDRGRDRFRHGVLPAGAPERPLPQEAHPDLLRLPQLGPSGRGGAAVQQHPHPQAPHPQRGRGGGAGQHGAQ